MTDQVVIVTSAGVARMQDEAARVAETKARGCVPVQCGDAIPVAPARGAFQVFEPMALYQSNDGKMKAEPNGYRGRSAIRCADVFDVMAAKAASHKKPSPFTSEQIAMGRYYRDLVERHACAGVKCSSIEVVSSGGNGQGGDFMDAVLRDREEIERLHRRIGNGAAMVVRRIRPSEKNQKRLISDRELVDCVCIEDRTFSEVLRSFGWVSKGQKVPGRHIKSLQSALGLTLDRMTGATPPMRVQVVRY